MKIYVLVDVSYDYYRFQNNIAASNDRSDIEDAAEKSDLPCYDYDVDSVVKSQLDDDEKCHLWVQEF